MSIILLNLNHSFISPVPVPVPVPVPDSGSGSGSGFPCFPYAQRQPSRVSYKIVTRLSYGKKKVNEIIHAEICPEIIKAEGYDVWTPCHRYHFVERYRSSKVMLFSKKSVS